MTGARSAPSLLGQTLPLPGGVSSELALRDVGDVLPLNRELHDPLALARLLGPPGILQWILLDPLDPMISVSEVDRLQPLIASFRHRKDTVREIHCPLPLGQRLAPHLDEHLTQCCHLAPIPPQSYQLIGVRIPVDDRPRGARGCLDLGSRASLRYQLVALGARRNHSQMLKYLSRVVRCRRGQIDHVPPILPIHPWDRPIQSARDSRRRILFVDVSGAPPG
jgi:hypothetical protein